MIHLDAYHAIAKEVASHGATLVAVSKFQSVEKIRQLLIAGHRDFGENYVQEAAEKWRPLKEEYPDVRLHLIGHLQSNKAREAVQLGDVIQTVDSPKLADALLKEMAKTGGKPDCFVQVNIGNEPQKSGIVPEVAGAFTEEYRQRGLPIVGLMCIPPEGKDPVPYFKALRDLAAPSLQLSMGMSADYREALACGANIVRVGSAIFGKRERVL